MVHEREEACAWDIIDARTDGVRQGWQRRGPPSFCMGGAGPHHSILEHRKRTPLNRAMPLRP